MTLKAISSSKSLKMEWTSCELLNPWPTASSTSVSGSPGIVSRSITLRLSTCLFLHLLLGSNHLLHIFLLVMCLSHLLSRVATKKKSWAMQTLPKTWLSSHVTKFSQNSRKFILNDLFFRKKLPKNRNSSENCQEIEPCNEQNCHKKATFLKK